jgi:biopolymer transport protein ExbD
MSADNSFDVWIVDRNTVYQKVPYDVVADWVQEGRLLERDCVRPAGQTTVAWQRIKEHPQLSPFLAPLDSSPEEKPTEVEQEVDLVIEQRVKESEDDDVDMIPLIDISMVLLVFFVMTAENLVAGLPVNSPAAHHAQLGDPSLSTIPITVIYDESNTLQFFVGDKGDKDDNRARNVDQAITKVKEILSAPAAFEVYVVVIRADAKVPFDVMQQLTEKLSTMRKRIVKIQAQVRHIGGE